jgi:Fic family protein
LISNWEAFVNNDNDRIDPLVKAAITHYQFESIHPFGDGNGRTGRILIVLYLIQQKLLSLPILYISGFINRNRREYYDSLQRVRSEGTWQEWIIYMLRGLNEQALQTKSTLFETLDLLDRFRESIQKSHPKIYSSDLVEALFASPIITPVNLGKKLRVNYRTASRYLAELARGKLLQDSYVGKYHVYANRPLLKLLHG